MSKFFTFFLNDFIDYYNSLNVVKDIPEEKDFSYIKFILSYIITDKTDTIENYSNIKANSDNIDEFYKKYVVTIFKDFKNICINCIKSTNIINNNIISDNNLKYYTKMFDFISITQRSNVIYNNMYNILKKLLFEFKENKVVVYIFDKQIKNYREKQEIQKDMIRLLSDKSLQGGYEYFNFIKNCFGSNINSNDNNFMNLFLDLLDEQNFITFIRNKNNNFNLKKIFINQGIINNAQIENAINNNKGIEKLKRNLSQYTTRKYIREQIDKYKSELNNNSKFLNYINNNNYNYNFSNILDNIHKNKYPFIYEVYNSLLQSLKNPNSNYSGNFGFIVIENKEYIFAYHNDEILERILYNANNIKKFEYSQILKYDNNSYLLSNEKKKDNHSSKSDKNNHIYNNNDNEPIITFKSNDIIINKKQYEEDELDLGYYKGIEFENNSMFLFRNLFDLCELPCYFFYVGNEKIEYQNIISFNDYNADLFTSFIEVDGAFINQSNEKLEPQLNKNFYPFLVQKTFIVSSKTVSKLKKNYTLTLADEKMEIAPKSIIIVESKLSIPKDKGIDIDNFKFYIEYEKSELDKTMIFTLNKVIKKKKIYSEFVQKEILKNKDDIKNYKFEFFLIYDNIPIKDVDSIIEKDLKKLIDNGFIADKFKLKVIYLMPNIGLFNLSIIKKDIKNLQEENKAQKNEINANNLKYQALCNENKNLKNQIDLLFNEVNRLKEKLNITA